jgi:phosphatidylglycerophosphatase A
MIVFIIVTFLYGIRIAGKFEVIYGKDPSECTIDEFVGTWIALLFIPKQWTFILISFCTWRLFDIVKPFPANRAERINGGLGIMLDDVIAALYSLGIVHIVIFFISKIN